MNDADKLVFMITSMGMFGFGIVLGWVLRQNWAPWLSRPWEKR